MEKFEPDTSVDLNLYTRLKRAKQGQKNESGKIISVENILFHPCSFIADYYSCIIDAVRASARNSKESLCYYPSFKSIVGEEVSLFNSKLNLWDIWNLFRSPKNSLHARLRPNSSTPTLP